MQQARQNAITEKPILTVLQRRKTDRVPFWMMRQAGRYLPEYRETRRKAGDFLGLCYTPELAIEVTLQPLRRFDMDAAILFSDILVVPHALGRGLSFVEGEGPKLSPLLRTEDIPEFQEEDFHRHLKPVYQAVSGISAALEKTKTLIGFAGAPWTVACYMVEGGGSKDFEKTRKWACTDEAGFQKLIDVLTEATIAYLIEQVRHGAQVLQIFDSWAGLLPERLFQKFVAAPTKEIRHRLAAVYPHLPVIGFPKGAGVMLKEYIRTSAVDAVGLDYTIPLPWAAAEIQPLCTVQGNLDPMVLLSGGKQMEEDTKRILRTLRDFPFIFNLGHGIHKDTPISHVEKMVEIVRDSDGSQNA